MVFLSLRGLTKSFRDTTVVKDFSLDAMRGEFISFLGPSGCGKTTVLRMIAGFEQPTAGAICIEGTDVTGDPASKRNIGMVFQAYALFPNMTVEGNIAFGLKVAGRAQSDIARRVDELLSLINLAKLAKRYPSELSGGQQQRVSLARALAREPRILLLDEPLSALDAKIRVSLRDELRALQRKLGITTIFVTHDQEEALALSDRVVVMSEGRIEQIGAPDQIYSAPASAFVATFVGAMNVLACGVVDPAKGQMMLGAQRLTIGRPLPADMIGKVRAGVRPENMTVVSSAGANRLDGEVEEATFLGPLLRLRARVETQPVVIDLFGAERANPPRIGERIGIYFAPENVRLLDAGPR